MESKRDSFKFTTEVLKRAQKLRNRRWFSNNKTPWCVVADTLNCSAGSLQVSVGNFKNGRRKGEREKQRQYLEQEMDGTKGRAKVTKLAKKLGVTPRAVQSRLAKMGLDGEVRREMSMQLPEV